jgi:hypothetical protein
VALNTIVSNPPLFNSIEISQHYITLPGNNDKTDNKTLHSFSTGVPENKT